MNIASFSRRRFCACDRRQFVHPICIVHLFLTTLHSHAHSMLRRAPFCQLLARLLPPLPLHQPRPRPLHLSPLTPIHTHTTLPWLNLNLRRALSVTLRRQKDAYPFNQAVDPVALNILTTSILYPSHTLITPHVSLLYIYM